MNIFDYPDGTYTVRAEFTRLLRTEPEISIQWGTVTKTGNGFAFLHIPEWPDYCMVDGIKILEEELFKIYNRLMDE